MSVNSFSQYRNTEISSDESEEYVDVSYPENNSQMDSIEVPDSDNLMTSDDEEIVQKKKRNVRRIESSDEELEEKRAIYSPRTRRSIHGIKMSTSLSDEDDEYESSFSEESSPERKDESSMKNNSDHYKNASSSYINREESDKTHMDIIEISKEKSSTQDYSMETKDKSTIQNSRTRSFANINKDESTKTQHTGFSDISKFSKIYESKSEEDPSINHSKTENVSIHFNSSIANKLSSTISNTPTENKPSVNSKNEKSIELLDNNNDVIVLNSSEESVSLVTSTPDVLSHDISTKKILVQPKISTALNTTPTSSRLKSGVQHPQLVSKEFLSREIRKLDELKTELITCQNLLKANVNLPDGGAKMRDRFEKCKIQIKKQANYVSNLVVDEEEIKSNRSIGIDKSIGDPSRDSSNISQQSLQAPTWDELAAAVDAILPKHTGAKGLATFAAQKVITVDRLKDIHGSLETCPDENVLADNPKALKIELMKHQKHALAWMQWREKQKPRGGILADDMGLGKTLTMISLILAQNEEEKDETEEESSSDEKKNSGAWLTKGRKDYFNGGTLIICPASLLQQWEDEIRNRCKRNALQVVVHHGHNRDTKARYLAKNDVVITTYHIVAREFKTEGAVFCIKWKRIILDEAHIIRNHKAQISISCCGLKARCRWALTGTPVQNKEMDLYAIMKFLKCSPFDDLGHWKKWIDNKSAGGQARLNTLMKSLLLRRTKVQLQQNDDNFKLPEKTIKLIDVILEKEEMNVYQKIMAYSQTLFAQFLHQRTERENDIHYGNSNNVPTYMQIKDPNGAFYKIHKKMVQITGNNKEVRSFEILVLLLRLRQICCHPGLIDSMLEEEDLNQTDSSQEHKEIDLLQQLEKLEIDDKDENFASSSNLENSREDLSKAAARVLRKNNPVFDKDRPSSKLNKILEVLQEILSSSNDKTVVVSQWTTLLDLLKLHLSRKGHRTVSLNGTVPVKNRNEIVTKFNDATNKTRIMLLSLTAGGVGLNLIGANHLLLIDLHWNPQLESQAQDRIYRVGQKKSVYIYKFMVKDTVEERIKNLQDKKLEIASNVLTGAKSQGSKLTMEDLKGLFGL